MKVDFTTGNFDLVIEGDLNADAQAKFLNAGLVYVVQRDGASKAYLELAGVENDKGKKQLPKDFERKTVAFNEENLAAMQLAFESALKPYGNFTISGSEHVAGADVSPMKRATEFVDSLLGNAQNEATLRQFLGMYDATASSADRDGLIKIANDNGVGKAKPKA
jgi:ABC-type phosphate transport system substrate-binding protein